MRFDIETPNDGQSVCCVTTGRVEITKTSSSRAATLLQSADRRMIETVTDAQVTTAATRARFISPHCILEIP
jgi:hypothetical protein